MFLVDSCPINMINRKICIYVIHITFTFLEYLQNREKNYKDNGKSADLTLILAK